MPLPAGDGPAIMQPFTWTRRPVHTLSIALVLYRTPPELLAKTLAHLRRALPCAPEHCRLVLVDNSPKPCTGPEIRELWPFALELIHDQGNPGFGAGHNLALARSQSRYHLILNPDALLDEVVHAPVTSQTGEWVEAPCIAHVVGEEIGDAW